MVMDPDNEMSSSTSTARPSPLPFPALHLGSFHSLSPESFPNLSPTKASATSPINSTSPSDTSRERGLNGDDPIAGPSRIALHSYNGDRASSRPSSAGAMLGPQRVHLDSSHLPLRSKNILPPILPPPSGMLPPLPTLSPISPLKAPSPSDFAGGLSTSISNMRDSPTTSSPAGPRQLNSRTRPLGPSLTIHTTSPLTPSSLIDKDDEPLSPPQLRDTANIPRRRTIIEASSAAQSASPVRVTEMISSMTPPDDSPRRATSQTSNDKDVIAMPVARPTPSIETRKVDDETRLIDATVSPVSPSKRSLPRPPPAEARSSFADRAGSSMPTPPPESRTLKPTSLPNPFYQQASTSASNLPIIAGLSDSGPYPSGTPRRASQAQLRTPAAIGLGRPASKATLQQPEEVCLECMMRDRDLADVDVQSPGIWERNSDLAWDEIRAREAEVLKSLGGVSVLGRRSGDESRSSESEGVAQRREVRHGSWAERSNRARELGYRGFSWEEEQGGEGLPKGFSGSKGGSLSEDGIKAIMAKFPSASAHRYTTLQVYLHNQYLLVQEIRQEARRTGRFPDPDDLPTAWSTVSSHDQRASGSSWEPRHIREINQNLRFPPVGKGVRPSPSSPADLAKLTINPMERPVTAPRPQTHFYPDREPALRSPVSAGAIKSELGNGFVGPIVRRTDDWDDDDPWGTDIPADNSLRPFSFAVRAGAAAGKDGSESSHGRKSMFGRWGGSVTSLFGGSHGGSGSMMDMHLGIESDRRNRASAVSNQHAPRSVSLASPSRPSFFASRASLPDDNEPERRMPRNVSASRLSQWSRVNVDEEEVETKPKKKGFKGFLQKMKPKQSRKESDRQERPAVVHVRREVDNDLGAPLAPPPPISYLVGRGDRKHSRDPSGSQSSMLTDSQASTNHPVGPYPSSPFGMRSVSAPLAGSSSGGSQSVSPTSSRFVNPAARRESYASAQTRRRSETLNEVGEENDRRGSGVEFLHGQHLMTEEPASMRPTSGLAISHVAPHVATYPPVSHRSQGATPTFSNSTGTLLAPSLETPPAHMSESRGSFSSLQADRAQYLYQQKSSNQSTPLSPNRFKNLPPLPPGQNDHSSPDSVNGQFAEQDFSLRGTIYGSRDPSPMGQGRNQPRHLGIPQQAEYPRPVTGYPHPRASFDPSGDRPNQRRGEMSPRLAQSMYVQPSANGSSNSFVRFARKDSGQHGDGYGTDGDRKSIKGKGFKGIFGGHKAGRMA